ncbi:hypothetical protein HYH03_016373 [Edaphochlamys debaryana]|uniref:Uncharacterized protein n=1 Tax=Edaphochlamys debaryana TaxID=47281 RepID=A0A835XHR1_9CHLO|nr:hypothetical protein HYH03_016373 [Edaphochlamys debaryana]|eukprot:KAG2484892.1 hypothetical protein HYH03_016373 [Edaphochlamys debaryana]
MSAGPFMFYRGSAKFYYRDMQKQNVVLTSPFYSAKARTWLQADMHIANAGRFKASDGTVAYDVNDFDESFVGSYLYDVYRLAASVALVARETASEKPGEGEPPKWLEDRNAPTSSFVCRFAHAYKRQIEALAKAGRRGKDNKPLDEDNTEPGRIRKLLGKKPGANDKWMDPNSDKLIEVPGSLEPLEDGQKVYEEVKRAVNEYTPTTKMFKELGGEEGLKYFTVTDIKQRLDAGTGSLGIPRFYVRIAGSSDSLLDVKQQGLPAWSNFVSKNEKKVAYGDLDCNRKDVEGARVALACKKMVSYGPDKHLGSLTLSGLQDRFNGAYSVRERSNYKKSLKLIFDDTSNGPEPVYMSKGDLELLAEQYGRLLANAHDRASDGTNKTPDDFAGEVWPLLKGRGDEFMSRVDTVGCAYARQVWVDKDLTLADW